MDYHPDINRTQRCLEICPPTFNDCDRICHDLSSPSPPLPLHPPPPIHFHAPPPSAYLPTSSAIATTFIISAAFLSCMSICLSSRKLCTEANALSSPAAPTYNTHVDHEQTHNPVVGHVATVGLEQSVLNTINVCRYKSADGLVEARECAVCLNEFRDGESLRLLPKCLHAFHVSCIDMWFKCHVNCPLCRSNVIPSPLISTPKNPSSDPSDVERQIHGG